MTPPTLMPAMFIGHGNPMNALEHNRYSDAWRRLGESLPRPTAILCVSAHWYTNATAVTAMTTPRTIHDVHNLRRIAWDRPTSGFDWNQRFDDAAASLMRDRPGDILELTSHPDYDLAVPTPDHFIPLLHIAGLAAASGETPQAIVEGSALGSLSMTSYGLGTSCDLVDPDATGDVGEPSAAPPDEANI